MITPVPNKMNERPGSVTLPETAGTFIAAQLCAAQDGIRSLLPMFAQQSSETQINFLYDAALPEEAYRLRCEQTGITVTASGIKGAVFGAATLRQLLSHNGALPLIDIEDAPRFGWRGMSMDICRHFFPIDTIKKLIDVLALYKFNALHLHLSDDQGFRVESTLFPRLNTVGSWRESSAIKRGHGEVQDGVAHGGFYTKVEIKALVEYTASRGIDIVPEIDLPGHTTAILAAYPDLACDARQTAVATSYGLKDFSAHILCAGEDAVYTFVFELIDELCALFPSPYFHIGGDEAAKDEWKKCPKCQRLMKEKNLANERELQGYMLERIREHLKSLGKEAVIWNDGLAGTTGTEFICQHWTPPAIEGNKRTVAHLNAGGRAIMSGFRKLYFDYPYAMTPLKKTYNADVMPRGLSDAAAERVLGCECAMWTEWVEDEDKLFFNLLPRLAAAGELFWSDPAQRDYADFVKRLPAQYRLYDAMGLPYAKGMENPQNAIRRMKTVRAFYATDASIELKHE